MWPRRTLSAIFLRAPVVESTRYRSVYVRRNRWLYDRRSSLPSAHCGLSEVSRSQFVIGQLHQFVLGDQVGGRKVRSRSRDARSFWRAEGTHLCSSTRRTTAYRRWTRRRHRRPSARAPAGYCHAKIETRPSCEKLRAPLSLMANPCLMPASRRRPTPRRAALRSSDRLSTSAASRVIVAIAQENHLV